MRCCATLFPVSLRTLVHPEVLRPSARIPSLSVLSEARAPGYGCSSCWGDIGAGNAEVDVIYTRYIIHRERPTPSLG